MQPANRHVSRRGVLKAVGGTFGGVGIVGADIDLPSAVERVNVGFRGRSGRRAALDAAVDLVTVPAAFDQFLSAGLGEGVFGEPSEPWNHKRDGVVVAAGAAVDESASCEGAHLFDVAPTVLAAMGLPADRDMDGAALPVVEAPGRRRYPPFEAGARTALTDHDVEARLADLGYLEGPTADDGD